MKWQVHQEYLKYLAQFAGPGLIGTPPEHATCTVQDALGNPTTPTHRPADAVAGDGGGAGGLPQRRHPGPAVRDRPPRSIQAQGDGAAFLRAIASATTRSPSRS
jgi:hypothetical protein